MSNMEKIIVLGGSGDQGIPLIRALGAEKFDVTAGVRRADAMQTTPFPAIKTVHADIMDVDTLKLAFHGQDALITHLPFEHDRTRAKAYGRNIAEAAKAVGLKKIVFNTSCYGAKHELGITGHDGRRDIKTAIASSGVPYVFIEPAVFMNNMIAPWCKPSIVKHNLFAYPAKPDLKISLISLDDVARLMVPALQNPQVKNQSFTVGGPEALTGAEISKVLSQAAGRDIQFKSLSPTEFAENISELVTGSRIIPDGSVYEGMAMFYSFYNDQPQSPLAVDPETFLTQLPVSLTSFSDWANAQDWSV